MMPARMAASHFFTVLVISLLVTAGPAENFFIGAVAVVVSTAGNYVSKGSTWQPSLRDFTAEQKEILDRCKHCAAETEANMTRINSSTIFTRESTSSTASSALLRISSRRPKMVSVDAADVVKKQDGARRGEVKVQPHDPQEPAKGKATRPVEVVVTGEKEEPEPIVQRGPRPERDMRAGGTAGRARTTATGRVWRSRTASLPSASAGASDDIAPAAGDAPSGSAPSQPQSASTEEVSAQSGADRPSCSRSGSKGKLMVMSSMSRKSAQSKSNPKNKAKQEEAPAKNSTQPKQAASTSDKSEKMVMMARNCNRAASARPSMPRSKVVEQRPVSMGPRVRILQRDSRKSSSEAGIASQHSSQRWTRHLQEQERSVPTTTATSTLLQLHDPNDQVQYQQPRPSSSSTTRRPCITDYLPGSDEASRFEAEAPAYSSFPSASFSSMNPTVTTAAPLGIFVEPSTSSSSSAVSTMEFLEPPQHLPPRGPPPGLSPPQVCRLQDAWCSGKALAAPGAQAYSLPTAVSSMAPGAGARQGHGQVQRGDHDLHLADGVVDAVTIMRNGMRDFWSSTSAAPSCTCTKELLPAYVELEMDHSPESLALGSGVGAPTTDVAAAPIPMPVSDDARNGLHPWRSQFLSGYGGYGEVGSSSEPRYVLLSSSSGNATVATSSSSNDVSPSIAGEIAPTSYAQQQQQHPAADNSSSSLFQQSPRDVLNTRNEATRGGQSRNVEVEQQHGQPFVLFSNESGSNESEPGCTTADPLTCSPAPARPGASSSCAAPLRARTMLKSPMPARPTMLNTTDSCSRVASPAVNTPSTVAPPSEPRTPITTPHLRPAVDPAEGLTSLQEGSAASESESDVSSQAPSADVVMEDEQEHEDQDFDGWVPPGRMRHEDPVLLHWLEVKALRGW